ncbi:MAG: hypothetical protein HN600_05460, partial [Bacteroidetes bacterium]|nr:hypothetical protein [Bacteroidota bacterium]
NYADSEFNKGDFKDVQKLGASCSTGCEIVNTGVVDSLPEYKRLTFRLVRNAFESFMESK